MSAVSQVAVKVKKKILLCLNSLKNTSVKKKKNTLETKVPAKVWAESMSQEQVMSVPLVGGVNYHVKMVSPVGDLLCSSSHLPSDVPIIYLPLLPKGVLPPP